MDSSETNSPANTEPEPIARRDKVVPILMLIAFFLIGSVIVGDLIAALVR